MSETNIGVYKEFIICSDYDDTLTYDKKLSQNNIETIRLYRENGGKFVILTSRDYSNTKEFHSELIADKYLVTNNGTVLYNDDKIVETSFLKPSPKEIIHKLIKNNLVNMIGIYYPETALFYKSVDSINIDSLNADNVTKILIHCNSQNAADEVIKLLNREFSEFCTVLKSSPVDVEVFNIDAGKGEMALKLKKIFKSKILIGIGDCESDESLLKVADIKVAPSNATDSIKNISDYIIENSEKGIEKNREMLYNIRKWKEMLRNVIKC